MREEVIREIVTRMLTDTGFAQELRERPGMALWDYKLTTDESAALQEQLGSTQVNPLEERISASLTRFFASDGDEGCGCVNVTPKKCK
jgi:hypothetical protein